ncbi:MAG: hypothetical protein A2284_00065 [Deltaproteobacteria bacterium RIFOXYA12_FULL_61_11]|nr:MAG: hypothetical protein A2284_00065 [Deltaproteobacteria bacterium RIFOXYA12_FULL_61_11]
MNAHILLIDDSNATLTILEQQLGRFGYRTSTASNGCEGLEQVRLNPPDLILCDVMMPVMDGLEFCRRLKGAPETRLIPLILVTARSGGEHLIEGLAQGADDYIVKPYNLGELRARVEAMLRMGRLQRELHTANEELRRAESQLVQSAKMAAVGQLGAGIAHELNQPLTAIKGYATLLQRDLRDHPRQNQHLEVIIEQAGRMAKIIQNIRTFSHQGEYAFALGQLHRPLDDALMLLRTKLSLEGIELSLELGEELPPVPNDPLKLQQVFLNLLQNATDALLEREPPRHLTIRGYRLPYPPPEQVILEFIDNGNGIDPEHLPRVLDPFFTTKEPGKGTGLGLSISLGIMRRHGGDLRLASRKGVGTTVTLNFPLKPPLTTVEDDSHGR